MFGREFGRADLRARFGPAFGCGFSALDCPPRGHSARPRVRAYTRGALGHKPPLPPIRNPIRYGEEPRRR